MIVLFPHKTKVGSTAMVLEGAKHGDTFTIPSLCPRKVSKTRMEWVLQMMHALLSHTQHIFSKML